MGLTYMETRTTQFSLGTWIQISDVAPLLSEPLPVTPTAGLAQEESPAPRRAARTEGGGAG